MKRRIVSFLLLISVILGAFYIPVTFAQEESNEPALFAIARRFTINFKDGNKNVAESITASENTYYTLPVCTTTKRDKYFSGWSDGHNTFSTGDQVLATANVNYSALWTPINEKSAVYVSATGEDTANTGFSQYAPLQTLSKALQTAFDNNLSKIFIKSYITSDGLLSFPAFKTPVTITGEGFEGALLFDKTVNLSSDITFEKMGLACGQYNFIITNCHDVVFGEGLERIDGKGIEVHAGKNYSASENIKCTVKSSIVDKMYLGGGYFNEEGVGISGDSVVNLENVEDFYLTLGFDGYGESVSSRSIEGNVFVNAKNSSIALVDSLRVTEMKGSFVVINKGGSTAPEAVDVPALQGGVYFITPSDSIEISSAKDDSGVISGALNVTCADDNSYIRVLKDGVGNYYNQGIISLENGEYFIDSKNFSFEISSPVAGHTAKGKTMADDGYCADISWYDGENKAERFEAKKAYTAKITVRFYYENPEQSDLKFNINGVSYPAEYKDGVYTVNYTFPATGEKNIVYLRSTGNDSNNGTSTRPVKTVERAIELLGGRGGIICVMNKVNMVDFISEHSYPLLITGEGYANAQINIPEGNALIIGGETDFENIKISTGQYAHINDAGNKLTFDDSVDISAGHIMHLGYYNENIKESEAIFGSGTYFGSVYVGGGYNTLDDRYIEGDINLTLDGTKVERIYFSLDQYNETHKGVYLGGNILLTLKGTAEVFGISEKPTAELEYSENSVCQLILYKNARFPEISESIIPKDKQYIVRTGENGTVLHAFDENGKSISGTFDIVPDKGYAAIVDQNGKTFITKGGRLKLESKKTANITFIKSDYPIEEYSVELNGGKAKEDLLNVDANGNIRFYNIPQKEGYIFEGWYEDASFTKLVKDGDYVGAKVLLYAKYIPVSFEARMEKFAVKDAGIRFKENRKPQGLRYVVAINKAVLSRIAAFSDKNGALVSGVTDDIGYGSVAIPKACLNEEDFLKIDKGYVYEGQTYDSKKAPAYKLFDVNDDTIYYTIVLTGIGSARNETEYVVAPYITYYNRSGYKASVYGNVYNSALVSAAFDMLEKGDITADEETFLRENMSVSYAEKRGISLIPKEILGQINDKTETYKQNILASTNMDLSGVSGKIYYVSNRGSDNNSGTSPQRAWATISKVNSFKLSPGDVVLFERGGQFRGRITAQSGVTYSAYGTGEKPIINGSPRNYADESYWTQTDAENVYMMSLSAYGDIGFIAFDHDRTAGNYDALVGEKKILGVEYEGVSFLGYEDLEKDLEFYYDRENHILYLYSEDGNPAKRFASLEIAPSGDLMDVKVKDVTVDNLYFRNGGSHGVGGDSGVASFDSNGEYTGMTGCANLKVTNCIFGWIGGAILDGFNGADVTRYGNAVEIYGSADGYIVENNWIYQIYDTGVTHQYSSSNCCDCMMQNITYKNNLIEYCHWSVEFYNQPCCTEHKRIVRNVLVQDNIIRMGGYGWGSNTRRESATLYNSFGLSNVESETENFHAKGNIFFRCTGPIYRLCSNNSERNLTFEENIYVQNYEKLFSYYCGANYGYMKVKSYVGEGLQISDKGAKTYFYAP